MDIKEFKEYRKKIETEILHLINEFESKTDMVIERIDLEHVQNLDGKSKVCIVKIKVTL